LLDRLDASLRRQRQFVADAAHELRSPVAALRSQLEVADTTENGGDPSPLTQESVRLSHLVDDLLALARIDAGPQHRHEPVDLDHLVYDEAKLLHERTDRIVDTRGINACQVVGDAPLLARAVRNLLDNAARHATTRVTITVRSNGHDAELTVADDGPGIPASERSRVLERFTRLDDARARDTGGVGLGLAIVDDIVKIHRGRLTITDNAPGARVTITLPTQQRTRDGV
jgi:signal transduction histidine kinase